MSKRVSKILLQVGDNYVFSKKRAPWSRKKDHKLELIGGALEYNESPFSALIRELKEEELSGILSEKAISLNPIPIEIYVGKEPHFIYRITISKDEYNKLIYNHDESYGYQLIQRNAIEVKLTLTKFITLFTPKTIRIFKALITLQKVGVDLKL